MKIKPEFILYDAAKSPCGRRVRMTLIEKGFEFEIRWLNLAFMDQKQSWYLLLNPNGVVPTLLHNKRTVYDSNVINEYLDSLQSEHQLIPGPRDLQIEMRMWMAFEMEWAKPFREAIYQTYGKQRLQNTGITEDQLEVEIHSRSDNAAYVQLAKKILIEEPDQDLLSGRIDILMERMSWMENVLSDKRKWLLGDEFSLADITLAPRLDLFSLIGVDDFYQRFPNIDTYMKGIFKRPSWNGSDLLPEEGNKSTFVSKIN
jgi:glutathione S-transferase